MKKRRRRIRKRKKTIYKKPYIQGGLASFLRTYFAHMAACNTKRQQTLSTRGRDVVESVVLRLNASVFYYKTTIRYKDYDII